jgi:hypothetical protein
MRRNKIVIQFLAALKAMKNIREFIDSKTLLQIYKSLVEPYFDYCLTVWDSMGIGLSTKLQKLLNRAACIITFSDCSISSTSLLEKLNWPNLAQGPVAQSSICTNPGLTL